MDPVGLLAKRGDLDWAEQVLRGPRRHHPSPITYHPSPAR
jgi:hypothetical protein